MRVYAHLAVIFSLLFIFNLILFCSSYRAPVVDYFFHGQTEPNWQLDFTPSTPVNSKNALNAGFPSKIPKILHMSSSVPHFTYLKNSQNSWPKLCPELEIRTYNDLEVDTYVKTHYPRFERIWPRMKKIEKIDFFRYLVLFQEGGIWADADVQPLYRCDHWLNVFRMQQHSHKIDFLVGVEFPKREPPQILQWIMASTPNNPILKALLENIYLVVQTHESLSDEDVLARTGPYIWTKTIWQFVSQHSSTDAGSKEGPLEWKKLGPIPHALNTSEITTDGQVFKLSVPEDFYMIALPYRAFGFHSAHSEAKHINRNERLSIHMFRSSWKKDNKRERRQLLLVKNS